MRKIGICTMYYKNRNYGANLQAYALHSVLESMGNEVRLIPYYDSTKLRYFLSKLRSFVFRNNDQVSKQVKIRNKAVDIFNLSIPHSKVYYSNTIHDANNDFDCFLTGSDQVWNPAWINQYTALTFANEDKLTVSYAASVGKINLNEEQKIRLKLALEHTRHISIREKESIPALQTITDKPVEYVLDPTMLLKREEWNEICSNHLVDDEYMFCYFLGSDNANLRKTAKEYAKLNNLKLVTMPYLNGRYRAVDDGFGDIQLYDVSPNDFLSLIKYASFVMTDSYHATVFSHLYETKFIVSGGGKDEMGCRMLSLTEMFGTEHRYIKEHDDVSVKKLVEIEKQPFVLKWDNYDAMRQKSFDFLNKVLNDDN